MWGAAQPKASSGHRPAEQLGRQVPAVGTSANWNRPPVPELYTAMPKHRSETGDRCTKIKKRKISDRKLFTQKINGVFSPASTVGPGTCNGDSNHNKASTVATWRQDKMISELSMSF